MQKLIFGFIDEPSEHGRKIMLSDMRNCKIYEFTTDIERNVLSAMVTYLEQILCVGKIVGAEFHDTQSFKHWYTHDKFGMSTDGELIVTIQ